MKMVPAKPHSLYIEAEIFPHKNRKKFLLYSAVMPIWEIDWVLVLLEVMSEAENIRLRHRHDVKDSRNIPGVCSSVFRAAHQHVYRCGFAALFLSRSF